MSLNIQILDAGDDIGLKVKNQVEYYQKNLISVYSTPSGLVGLRLKPTETTTSSEVPLVEAHPIEYLSPKEASVKDLVEQIKGILVTIPNTDLTLSQLQAIQNANSPSASNVFVTFLDMIASLIGFTPNGDILSTNVQDAIVEVRDDADTKLALKQDLSEKGQPNGYASLDATGKVPLSELPSSALGVESVTGDGVDNTDPQNPVLSFPDADQVDDSATTNKFATQIQLEAIASNTQDILDNTQDITNVEAAIVTLSSNKRDLTAQKNSIESDSGDLQLVGDQASPANSLYYGTNSSGTKGYHPIPGVTSFNVDLDSSEATVSRVEAGGRTTFTITHGLGTLDLKPEVYRLSDGRTIGWRIERTGVNTVEASRNGSVADGLFRILM